MPIPDESRYQIDYKKIGKRIKIARINCDISQEQLANEIGVTKGHISNIERRGVRIGLETLLKIANAMDVNVDYLLCDSLTNSKDAFENEITRLAKNCTREETKVLAEALGSLLQILRDHLHTNRPRGEQ